MKTFVHKDFSAGWCPSDSPVNGRANGLIRMAGLELDQNGELVMAGGIKTIGSSYAAAAHTIFSKFLGAVQYRYLTLTNGTTYRNNTSIKTGGSTTRTAFGYAYDYVLGFSDTKRFRDDGSTCTDLGQTKASVALTVSSAGAGVLTGVYTYVQVNVFVNGAYKAKSALNTSVSITATAENVNVTAQNPTAPSNEVWIFRKGGTLQQYYRVKRLTSSYSTLFVDNVTDETAILENVTLNDLAVSINSTDFPDAILEVVGPVNGRLFFFTANTVYPSEVNSPESYVPGQGVPYSGNASGSEVFLWAKKVARKVIMVGTTKDVYIITGTFITMPTGVLDIDIFPLGVHDPPISIDAAVYNSSVAYMAHSGWVICDTSGNIINLCDDRIDKLYRGESTAIVSTSDLNAGVPIYIYPATGPGGASLRYSCAIARDKLFCRMPVITANDPTLTFGSSVHIYDFKRKYWREGNWTVPDMFFAQEDGAVIGFVSSDLKLKEFDYQFSKTNDGTNLNIDLRFPTWNLNGNPGNRKDLWTLRFKIDTGNANVGIRHSLDDGVTFSSAAGNIAANGLTEVVVSYGASSQAKSFTLRLVGSSLSTFRLCDVSVEYEERPEPTLVYRHLRYNLGEIDGQYVRVGALPIVIDTFGVNVTMTPIINNAAGTPSTINTTGKRSVKYYFTSSDFVKDIGFTLVCTTRDFELYEVLPPELIQVLPKDRLYSQYGNTEFHKYGKVIAFRVRVYTTGSSLDYSIVLQEGGTPITGTITTVSNTEDVYEVTLPKTTAGQIFRITFTSGVVHCIYYVHTKVAKGGRDTENEWVPIET